MSTSEHFGSGFDFSTADQERAELERFLRAALEASKTDEELEAALRQVFARNDYGSEQNRWLQMRALMEEYRRGNEVAPCSRTLAERLLADLPNRYAHR